MENILGHDRAAQTPSLGPNNTTIKRRGFPFSCVPLRVDYSVPTPFEPRRAALLHVEYSSTRPHALRAPSRSSLSRARAVRRGAKGVGTCGRVVDVSAFSVGCPDKTSKRQSLPKSQPAPPGPKEPEPRRRRGRWVNATSMNIGVHRRMYSSMYLYICTHNKAYNCIYS